ncbi:thiamine biosynthesis oxidoreductase ThiO [Ameyamaea chiangmaiensis NBRC 103196]|uniref:Glycine oxidase ThiO n=1 Tax=Ameyamaea chiangmaiensis TaxID=442969 RepID=A0A850PBY8_9PROT|nr:glycine oxidase ThiO [Ameyamaea chiangmaiensis]MBS4073619.1 glycine oxidase ThiO [Ameyamaea chiangmaiensis]NVN40040.1 glycine oxidase ThiO [Ameyamaea chiangmaiensis]GBQ69049.1 thiamine biosynthesis oxidoreductase ThiO [Ameyamaea chiangmaiensis NBRC 103196]
MTQLDIVVRGAGVAGLVTATELADRGARVTVLETGPDIGSGASWKAGGMLAPWCEAESAPDEVTADSLGSVDWWAAHVPSVQRNGSLVVAPPRDVGDISRFGRRTQAFETLAEEAIGTLEPDLLGRFSKALFFPREGHVDPREALRTLRAGIEARGGSVLTGVPRAEAERASGVDWTIDCTGLAARSHLTELRGVRGEMLLLRCPDVILHRPVRMLHPRIPIYIVPRADHVFMVGATMVESENAGGMTLRSMTDLLNAAYVLHPAFADAEILETGVGLRPSFRDNVPRVRQDGRTIMVNGMYRHGFLLSPARARTVAELVFGG